MAFTRKFLEAMGIDESKIQSIIDAHVESLDGIKSERDNYKADSEKLADIQKKLAESTAKYDELNSKFTDTNAKLAEFEKADYMGQLASKDKEIESLRNEFATKEIVANKKSTLSNQLKALGYSDNATRIIVNRSDFANRIEFDSDGKASNIDNVISEIQADSDFGGFTPQTTETEHVPANPPTNSGGTGWTKEKILAEKDMGKQLELVAENLELFGK